MRKIIGCRVEYFTDNKFIYSNPFYFYPYSTEPIDKEVGDQMYQSIKRWRSKSPRNITKQISLLSLHESPDENKNDLLAKLESIKKGVSK